VYQRKPRTIAAYSSSTCKIFVAHYNEAIGRIFTPKGDATGFFVAPNILCTAGHVSGYNDDFGTLFFTNNILARSIKDDGLQLGKDLFRCKSLVGLERIKAEIKDQKSENLLDIDPSSAVSLRRETRQLDFDFLVVEDFKYTVKQCY
jgi:hypothetical protein